MSCTVDENEDSTSQPFTSMSTLETNADNDDFEESSTITNESPSNQQTLSSSTEMLDAQGSSLISTNKITYVTCR